MPQVVHAFATPLTFPKVFLASKSPRRAQLLQQIGVAYEVVLPEDDAAAEALEAELDGELPLAYVARVSLAKAHAMAAQIARQYPDRVAEMPVVCADTTVALGELILGKPADAADVAQMLRQLSGQAHSVHTAVVVAFRGQFWQQVVTTQVQFRVLTEADISAYIASGEPFGKAGAYAIQGLGACFIAHLAGSYSAVKGLPLFELSQMLSPLADSISSRATL